MAPLPALPLHVDCRAYYDPAYDELIYGAPGIGAHSRPAVLTIQEASELDSVEVIQLFRSIFRFSMPEIDANTSDHKASSSDRSQPVASPVTWIDYAELIDTAVAAN